MTLTNSCKMYLISLNRARANMQKPVCGTLLALATGARSSAGCGVLLIDSRDFVNLDESLICVDSDNVTKWRGDADARKLASKLNDVLWYDIIQTDVIKPNAEIFEYDAVGIALHNKFDAMGYDVVYDGSHAALHRDWYIYKNGVLVWHVEAKGRMGRFTSNQKREELNITDYDYSLNKTFEKFIQE